MKAQKKPINHRQRFLIATLIWFSACIIGAIPYLISGTFDNFIDAFFESSSGFTTTGATVITDLSVTPWYILLWRSITHWLGGMGIVVLFAAIFPTWGIRGQLAAYAETPGPSKGKLTARFSDTAKDLYILYIGLTLVLFILLRLFGMSWLDSITTAFSTMATGGFANYNNSAQDFSTPVKIILMIFMYVAGINFNLLFRARKNGIRILLKDQELRFYTLAMAIGSLLIFAVNTLTYRSSDIGHNLMDSFFHVISINTTTGFTIGDYELWPTTSKMILLCFFFIGACASSTGGGIKVSRIIICLKLIKRSFSMRIHPTRVGKITINNMEISTDVAIKTTGFVFTYLGALIIGTLLISLNGLGFMTSFSCTASCLANIGPGFGLIGPAFNFSVLSQMTKLICSILMIIGRLELYTVIVLFSRYYWNPNKS